MTDDPVVLDYISTNSLHLELKEKLIDLSKQNGAIMDRVGGQMVVRRPADMKVIREVEESIRDLKKQLGDALKAREISLKRLLKRALMKN